MKACFLGNLALVKYFTDDLKADPTILDEKDENSIFASVRGNNEDVLSHLLTLILKPEVVDYECSRNGYTAFALAVMSG